MSDLDWSDNDGSWDGSDIADLDISDAELDYDTGIESGMESIADHPPVISSRHDFKDKLLKWSRDLADVLGLPNDFCLKLLHIYNWDSDEALSNYLDDKTNCLRLIGLDTDSMRDQIKPGKKSKISGNFTCPACLCDISDGPSDSAFTFELGCEHKVCIDCYRDYLKAHLLTDKRIFSTKCPGAEGCNILVCRSSVEQLLGPKDLDRYDANLVQVYIDSRKDLIQCPHPDCFYVTTQSHQKYINCRCGREFCPSCLIGANHLSIPCDLASKWVKLLDHEYRSADWINQNTKSCTKCQSPIVRDEGCNHMECGTCGNEFCWICLQDWSDHTGNSLYNCAKFVESLTSSANRTGSADSNSFKPRTKHQRALLRYYSIRYDDHASPKLIFGPGVSSVLLTILKTSSKKANDVDEILRLAHVTLAWSYALLYMIPSSNQRSLLEGIVTDLERAVENFIQYASKILSGDHENEKFSSQLPDLTAYISQRTKKLRECTLESSWTFDRNILGN